MFYFQTDICRSYMEHDHWIIKTKPEPKFFEVEDHFASHPKMLSEQIAARKDPTGLSTTSASPLGLRE